MWVFTNKGFVSIVQHNTKKNTFIVRARFEEHIKNLFPDANVLKTPDADYRFRAFISKQIVSKVIASNIDNIDYGNFKNSIDSRPYHDACINVWGDMYRAQQRFYD
ncbi:MAG TPA: hypothetical protein PLT19_10870 [Syntrophorhabdaceae bacterium]|jgi:hypothetical protein|nr:hypothetical protein [Syntrophorhabdaceae bacterium]